MPPVEFVIGAAHALEMVEAPPSTLALADWAARLGQDLFYPPNVGGWPGGRAWITTRSALGRANFAAALVAGPGVGRPEPFDAVGLAAKHGRDGEAVLAFYGELLRGAAPTTAECDRILTALRPNSGDPPAFARNAVALLLAAPEGQLG